MKFGEMLKGSLPHDIPRADGSVPEALAGVDFAYHVPFDWGVLQVSRTAHEHSGLVPLRAVDDGISDPLRIGVEGAPQARVNIVDLTEMEKGPDPTEPHSGVPIGIHAIAKQGLVEVTIGVDRRDRMVDTLIEDAKQQLAQARQLPYAVEEEDLPPMEEGLTMRETLTHEFPQMYSHAISSNIFRAVGESFRSYVLLDADNKLVKRNRNVGRVTLASAGLFGGVVGIVANDPVFAVVMGGYNFYLGNNIVNDNTVRHLRTENDRKFAAHNRATVFADQVSEGVHKIYCANHFAENILGHPDLPTE